MESESDPLTRRAVDLFEKEPLKGNSEVHLHTPTKFGEDRSKDLGGDREQTDRQTNRQTDKRCSIYSMMILKQKVVQFFEEDFQLIFMNHIRLLIRNQCGSLIIHGLPNPLAFQQHYSCYDGPSESGIFSLLDEPLLTSYLPNTCVFNIAHKLYFHASL